MKSYVQLKTFKKHASVFLDKVFLHHPWHLPESCNDEGDRRMCRGKGVVQAAVLPEAHGAQTE